MQKPSEGVRRICVLILLYPIFLLIEYFVLADKPVTMPKGVMLNLASELFLSGLLAYWVWRLNKRARLAAIILALMGAIAPFLGFLLALLLNPDLFGKALKMYGAEVIIVMPLMILLVTFLPAIFGCGYTH